MTLEGGGCGREAVFEVLTIVAEESERAALLDRHEFVFLAIVCFLVSLLIINSQS
jgi:hypothetical protein